MDETLNVFLDRDGVISCFYPGGYTRSWAEFEFIPGALEALRLLRQAGARVVVVSNQAGINQGLFSREDLDDVDRRMREEVSRAGGFIESSRYCPHTPEEECSCRKPGTGLIEGAVRELSLDLGQNPSYMVGDTEQDIVCGHRMGLVTVLVLSGRTVLREEAEKWKVGPDHVAADLLGAIDYII